MASKTPSSSPCSTSTSLEETLPERIARVHRMNCILIKEFPQAHCELNFTTALELLVATILAAQCTDVRVNQVTPQLFRQYPNPTSYAQANREELEEIIKPTGFYRNKASSLIELGRQLLEQFDGIVPQSMEELTRLPGVGRKTANVVLGNVFGIPGITVDTHFKRLALRFGWVTCQDPVKIEHEVEKLIEPDQWVMLSHRVVFHGRRVCHARKPACGACALAEECPSYGLGPTIPEQAAKLIKGPETAHLLHIVGLA